MAGVGTAKAVDRLGVVTDHREAAPVRPQPHHDLDLERVDVLVLVDEHVVEHPRQPRGEPVVAEGGPPVEEQVVEVQLAPRPLVDHVGAEQLRHRREPRFAPREVGRHDLAQWASGVDAAGVHVDQRRRPRDSFLLPREAVLVAQHVHNVGGVGRVEHREPGPDSENLGPRVHHLGRDGVKGAAA